MIKSPNISSAERVARRYVLAGLFQAPPRMQAAIEKWVLAQLAANHTEKSNTTIQELQTKQQALGSSDGVKRLYAAMEKLREALRTAKTRVMATAYQEFWESTTSLWGYGIPQMTSKNFTGLDNATKLRDVQADVEQAMAAAKERLENSYLLAYESEMEAHRRIQAQWEPYLMSGVAPATKVVQKSFPVDLDGWRYGGQSLVEAARVRAVADVNKRFGDLETPEAVELQQMALEQARNAWDVVYVVVNPKPAAGSSPASWSPALHRIEINDFKAATVPLVIQYVREGIQHELQHFGQQFLADVIHNVDFLHHRKKLQVHGLPSRHLVTPEYDQMQSMDAHALDDTEFYPQLYSVIQMIRRTLNELPQADRENGFRFMVGLPTRSRPRGIYSPYEFFVTLRRKAKPKWVKAVKEAYKEVFGTTLQVTATKSDAQKEDKDIRQMLKGEPDKKPPREDLRRTRMRVDDPDLAGDDKDMSLNYKIVASLVGRWLRAGGDPEHKPGDVWRSESGKWVGKNPAGNTHSFDDKSKAEAFAQGADEPEPKKSDPKKSEPEKSDPKKSEPEKSDPKKSKPKESDPKKSEPEKSESESEKDPLAFLGGKPLSKTPLDEKALVDRAEETFKRFRAKAKSKARKEAAEQAATKLDALLALDPDSPEITELHRIIDAIHLAMESQGETWDIQGSDGQLLREPLDKKMAVLANQMIGQGHVRVLLSDGQDHHAVRESVWDAMGRLDDSGLQAMSKETPWEPLGDLLGGLQGMTLDPDVAELLRGLVRDLSLNSMTTNQGLINAVAGKKMSPSNPLEAYEEVRKQFSSDDLEDALSSLAECIEEGGTVEDCREQMNQARQTQLDGMADNLEKTIKAAGVEPDPQNPHVAAIRHAQATGDASILDENLTPVRTFQQEKAEFIQNLKDPEERKRVQKMDEPAFRAMLEGMF